MEQLILHLLGDYVTQSHWMANEKVKRWWPALAHAMVYALPFLLLGPSLTAFAVILGTHAVIDRFRLARFVVWLRNVVLMPPWLNCPGDWWDSLEEEARWRWRSCSKTGFPDDVPPFL